jgi:hypothetical protein
LKKRIIVKILSWIIALPVGGVLVVFSVVNRHSIRLDFWPLSLTAEVRLFVLILGILAVGVLWGGDLRLADRTKRAAQKSSSGTPHGNGKPTPRKSYFRPGKRTA